jgi:hypothetical protein
VLYAPGIGAHMPTYPVMSPTLPIWWSWSGFRQLQTIRLTATEHLNQGKALNASEDELFSFSIIRQWPKAPRFLSSFPIFLGPDNILLTRPRIPIDSSISTTRNRPEISIRRFFSIMDDKPHAVILDNTGEQPRAVYFDNTAE